MKARANAVEAAIAVAFLAMPLAAAEPPVGSDLRRNVALQLALEKSGFSPGLIDGTCGPKTTRAVAEFQRSRRLAATGQADARTRALLGVEEDRAFSRYTITAADRAAVGPLPSDWNARARLSRMPYANLAEVVAEKHHCHRRLLAQLNPAKPLEALAVGDALTVPNTPGAFPAVLAARLEVNLAEKIIRAIAPSGEVVALFHCSIPARKEKLPSGSARVEVIVEDPTYTFNPEMWPEVKSVKNVLTIPPGPRNPVGIRWIGLSLPGVGIHGTPNPELIGKTGSHGCIRLTNWDAARLARLVSTGMPVRFVGAAERLADSSAPR
jgi:lipoprotein-anchoring transpeptidase ErfK/SrfK